nr:DUF3983 domain-containing protein [Bacillus thuringiensis]
MRDVCMKGMRGMANAKKKKIRKAIARRAIGVDKYQPAQSLEKHLCAGWYYQINENRIQSG